MRVGINRLLRWHYIQEDFWLIDTTPEDTACLVGWRGLYVELTLLRRPMVNYSLGDEPGTCENIPWTRLTRLSI